MPHEFALSLASTGRLFEEPRSLAVTDGELIHRMTSVLRLEPQDVVIFFDDTTQYTCIITALLKKRVVCTIIEIRPIPDITPHLHWIVPVSSKSSLEDSIYVLAALRTSTICVTTTEKSARFHGSLDRLYAVARAATEQAKSFVMPHIFFAPFEEALSKNKGDAGYKLFFDPSGTLVSSVLPDITHVSSIQLLVGPSGDLTFREKESVKEAGFVSVALTETILRSEDAIQVATGIIRACVRSRL